MLKIKSYILLNSDIEDPPENIDPNSTIITYGLNPKATITASSIGEDEAFLCIQRSFENAKGEEVEPQEIAVSLEDSNRDMSDVLCENAISLVTGTTF